MYLQKKKIYSVALSALFAAVTAICALITVPAPVPFTLQALGVFTATAVLSAKYSIASVCAYILLGAVGLPVFSGFSGGPGVLFGPTGGFIFGFILIPVIYGLLSRFFSGKSRWLYMLAGLLACYAAGAAWYTVYTGADSFVSVLTVTVLPFILPDILKLFVALKVADALMSAGLLPEKDRPSAARLRRHISGSVKVFTYGKIGSTNTEAVKRVNEGLALPALFVAGRQTSGRGRRGRSFYSEGGLYMTLALDVTGEDTVELTTRAAVAVAEAIEELTGQKTGIKWVNDIYLDGRKICGILCEAIRDKTTGEIKAVAIGVGINLNVDTFPKELEGVAGSLTATGLKRELLAAAVTQKLLEIIGGKQSVTDRYRERSIVIGQSIRYEINGAEFSATALDIDHVGGLIVQNEDGSIRTLSSGEITLRLK